MNIWLAKLYALKSEKGPTRVTDKTDKTYSDTGFVSFGSAARRPISESEDGSPAPETGDPAAAKPPTEPAVAAPPRMARAKSLGLLAAVEAELAGARGLLGPEPSEITRARCASAAVKIIAELGPHPRGGCSPARWQQFTADVGGFVENGWLHQAHELGWDDLELLGCDRVAPWARYDHMGLLLMLNSSKVIGLTDRVGRIVTAPTGARRTYYRVPLDRERVVPIDQIRPSVQ
jgi:hypothetical protein